MGCNVSSIIRNGDWEHQLCWMDPPLCKDDEKEAPNGALVDKEYGKTYKARVENVFDRSFRKNKSEGMRNSFSSTKELVNGNSMEMTEWTNVSNPMPEKD